MILTYKEILLSSFLAFIYIYAIVSRICQCIEKSSSNGAIAKIVEEGAKYGKDANKSIRSSEGSDQTNV